MNKVNESDLRSKGVSCMLLIVICYSVHKKVSGNVPVFQNESIRLVFENHE